MIPRSPRHSYWIYAALPAALTTLLFSCSSSSGGGGPPKVTPEVEPNDVFDDVDVADLKHGTAGFGMLASETDVDYWSMHLEEGDIISIELFGARLDHAAWDGSDSIPRITIYDTDGKTVLVHHQYDVWEWGKNDLDHPMLRVPVTGIYYASVTCDGLGVTDGKYCIRTNRLNVGSLQAETGDDLVGNDDYTTAELINPGTVYGFHDDSDSDFYSFTLTGPSIVRFEITTYRNGIIQDDDSYYDPELIIWDTDGITELTRNDDAYFYDSAINYQIDQAGTYFIEVNQYLGNTGDAPYFLSYSRSSAGGANESEPNEDTETADPISYGGSINGTAVVADVDGFKFNGKRGDMVRVQLFDSSNSLSKAGLVGAEILAPDAKTVLPTGGDPIKEGGLRTLTTILQEDGTHYIVVGTDGKIDTDYRVELTLFKQSTGETEPNNILIDANSLGSKGRSEGVIESVGLGAPTDSDVFKFSAKGERLTTISIYASYFATSSDGFFNFSGHGSDLEPTLRILDEKGSVLAIAPGDWLDVDTECVTNGLPCGAVSFVPTADGTYFVEVTDAFNESGPTFYYVIEKTE